MAERQPIPRETEHPGERKLKYLETTEAYDRWAAVYDADSNPLQALDDVQMAILLPKVLELAAKNARSLHIVDLGCGTGRNTLKLLSVANATIVGFDSSEKMLDVARERCNAELSQLSTGDTPSSATAVTATSGDGGDHRASSVDFVQFDMLHSTFPSEHARSADLLISTLVAEHIPLRPFFSTAAAMLRPGGYVLVTNMHPDMGARSQAGFVDPETGDKVRPTSYAHGVAETADEAERNGLELVEGPLEREVEPAAVQALGKRSEKWVGVKIWMGLILRKAESPEVEPV